MNFNDDKFRDSFSYRLDAKGRVSVPPNWRTELGDRFVMMEVSHVGYPALKVMSKEALDAQIAAVRATPGIELAEANDYIGMISARTKEGSLNEQGKLLVPKLTAETLELELPGPVMLSGQGSHFIIINTDHLIDAERKRAEVAAPLNKRFGLI